MATAPMTGARVIRSFVAPDPAIRKSLNKSLAVKPPLTLSNFMYSTRPGFRYQARRDEAVIQRGAIPGVYQAKRAVKEPFLLSAQSSGYAVYRATQVANRSNNVNPPGGMVTPIPAAGSPLRLQNPRTTESPLSYAPQATGFWLAALALALVVLRT